MIFQSDAFYRAGGRLLISFFIWQKILHFFFIVHSSDFANNIKWEVFTKLVFYLIANFKMVMQMNILSARDERTGIEWKNRNTSLKPYKKGNRVHILLCAPTFWRVCQSSKKFWEKKWHYFSMSFKLKKLKVYKEEETRWLCVWYKMWAIRISANSSDASTTRQKGVRGFFPSSPSDNTHHLRVS